MVLFFRARVAISAIAIIVVVVIVKQDRRSHSLSRASDSSRTFQNII